MKAVLSKAPGGAASLVLEEVADPAPQPREVVVRVAACGVNFPDSLIIEDKYQIRPPRPFSPGGEVAGVIESVGAAVAGLRVGERVLASPGWGGMAEKVAVAASRVMPIPDAMPFDEAASLLFTYGTTYHALKDRAHLKPGESLLALGAAGGVGSAAVELGKAMGARVIAAASSQEKVDLAMSWGADSGVVYPAGPFDKEGAKKLADLFKSACGEGGADVVYDAVGGDYSEAALRAIAWEGRFLVVGFPAGIARIPLNLALLKGCQIVGVFWGDFARRNPEANAANNAELIALYEAGKIRPRISARFPLARASEAIALLAERGALGKVVVTMP
ncbi:MAG: NADPH:quinone oxidoreductase family protein [Roseiarcus sp.]